MTKIVLVETMSTFRHMYAVEINDNDPIDYALDSVVNVTCGGESKLEEFAQNHISETIFSHRVVTKEEYLKIFDQENGYLSNWTDEQKKKFIYNGDK